MAESAEELQSRLESSTQPGFRERLLDRGLARGLIWRDGVLPPGSPDFIDSLTEDLLDYAHTILGMALRLRSMNAESGVLPRAFLVAGEAIEAAVHRGDGQRFDSGFNRVSAAVAFHLARYAARSYSILPSTVTSQNLAPTEVALVLLLRRALDTMRAEVARWLLGLEHQDANIAKRLRDDPEFDDSDAWNEVLSASFMRGIALFDHAITTGDGLSAEHARERFQATANAAQAANAVGHWWTATLAAHLTDELWDLSLHRQLPLLPSTEDGQDEWNNLRRSYIERLRAGNRAAIELWPSQLEAARRAVDQKDDLVVALPTSAGKTRIAELCILRALSAGLRVIYVTPLRALSAQVERDLADTFSPLGFSVSALYGAAGIETGDAETLREGKIVVSTPEKLDFALRNDPTLIDDVGLIVLDEGHMLGPNEREVRYEALVQRLLRRDDAADRRLVCLSALFPTPAEMSDLVAWIRQDAPGSPVHSTWRPTRQRFGVLRWLSDGARLDVAVEGESPYVPRFVEPRNPPAGSRRRIAFPDNKNELTLASAWRFVEQDKAVLIYCPLRASVETLGELVLKCIKHGVLQSLGRDTKRVKDAMATGAEWLGPDHPAVQCLQYGVALHHGGLPRPFLNEVERLLREGDCRVTIASPTLAQGLNLSASVLLVPSIWRNQEIIPPAEFANVAGRAGRAFVDVEGLVLHIVWEDKPGRIRWTVGNWERLVSAAKAPAVESGILRLCVLIFERIAAASSIPLEDVVAYVTGHGEAWEFSAKVAGLIGVTPVQWERDIASLDAAMLALLDAEANEDAIDSEIDAVLQGSLFSRQMALQKPSEQTLLRSFLVERTRHIWSKTSASQRQGYHVAGIGLGAGQFLDEHLGGLVAFLLAAEQAVSEANAEAAGDAVIEFAKLVFQTAPFRPPDELPGTWNDALRAWLRGKSASEVVKLGGEDGVGLLQEAFTYRLPWAMEAVRVHAKAVGHENAEDLKGLAAMAVEAGSTKFEVITLLRSGLSSREAASTAVASTSALFDDRAGMTEWLWSDDIQRLSDTEGWPTAQSRHAWLQFLDKEKKGGQRKWLRETQFLLVEWTMEEPPAGAPVVLDAIDGQEHPFVLTPDLTQLGIVKSVLKRSRRDIVGARVGDKPRIVIVEYFGPRSTR